MSNGAGDPNYPDYASEVRGLAVTFHLPDDSRTDIVAQTVPRFPVRTPEEFIELLRLSNRSPLNAVRMPLFLARRRAALLGLPANAAALRPPPSYAECKYFGVHAFKWIDADGGERFVRYTFVPEAGDHRLPWNPLLMPNRKTDSNNNFAFSTDDIGMNYAYPDGDYATRAKIIKEHIDYLETQLDLLNRVGLQNYLQSAMGEPS